MRFSNDSDGRYIVKVWNGGRDRKNPALYLPVALCTKWQIQHGDKVVIKDSDQGIEITPYIPTSPLEE